MKYICRECSCGKLENCCVLNTNFYPSRCINDSGFESLWEECEKEKQKIIKNKNDHRVGFDIPINGEREE